MLDRGVGAALGFCDMFDNVNDYPDIPLVMHIVA